MPAREFAPASLDHPASGPELDSASNNEDIPTPIATLDSEWSLLRAACSVIPAEEKRERLLFLLRQPVRWDSLLDLALRHGTQPLLYQALSEIEGKSPGMLSTGAMRALQRNHELNLRKSLLLSRELIRILDRLESFKIEAIPYKGLALAEFLYGDIALRQAGDIDLLIRPQDFPRVRDAARDLGFTPHTVFSTLQERAYLKSGYECSFDGSAGPNLLEVQWAIQPRFYAIDFDMAGIFERAVTVNVAGPSMRTLSAEDLFLVLSAHAAKHVWGRLIWICDLARIMALPNLNWGWIASQAKTLGMIRILRVSMLAAHKLLRVTIPKTASQSFLAGDDPVADPVTEEIQTHLVSEIPYNVESFAYFRLMLRLRERSSDRRRFLQRLILTPGPSEWDAVRLPEPLFPLYRFVRLARLAARLVHS
jgi:hypothetical protein